MDDRLTTPVPPVWAWCHRRAHRGMLISEPYLLSLRKSLMLFDCTVGECSELPILYSIVNYPRKTWRAKLVLSTGLIFFLSFFFFLFFFPVLCVRSAWHCKLQYLECPSVSAPMRPAHRYSAPGHSDSACQWFMFLEEIFLLRPKLLFRSIDCTEHVSV